MGIFIDTLTEIIADAHDATREDWETALDNVYGRETTDTIATDQPHNQELTALEAAARRAQTVISLLNAGDYCPGDDVDTDAIVVELVTQLARSHTSIQGLLHLHDSR